MDILILAGGRCPPDLAESAGTPYRALIPFGEQTFVQIVQAAASSFGRAFIVAPEEAEILDSIPSGESFVQSLANGLEHITTDNFLLCTADLPFLTQESISDFLALCDATALLNYPIVDVGLSQKMFPGMKRTTLRLREGEFTGGNVALVRTHLMRQALPHLEQAYSNRKKVLQLGRQVGLGTLFRIAISRVAPRWVTVSALEKDVSRLLGSPVRAIICPHAELGADIDNDEQYRLAKKLARLP